MNQKIDLQALYETSPNPYLVLSPNLTIIDANDSYLRTAAKTRSAIVGRHIFDAFPGNPNDPNDTGLHDVRTSLERVIETRKPDALPLVQYSIPRETPEHTAYEVRWWSIIHTPVLDERGGLMVIYQNPIDVTEVQLLRNALQSAQAELDFHPREEGNVFHRAQVLAETNRVLDAELSHLRRLFRQAPGFIAFMRGREFVFELANEAYYQLAGHRDIIGKKLLEALPEIAGQGYLELLEQAFDTGEPYVGRNMQVLVQRTRAAPLTEVVMDLVLQPVMEPDGAVSGIFVLGHDITLQKQAQDALIASEQRMKLALEAVGDGIWDWDVRAGIVTYSRRWKSMLGYAEHEIGNTVDEWTERVHADDRLRLMAEIQVCLAGKSTDFSSEYRIHCKDGSWKWVLGRGAIVSRDAAGATVRMIGTNVDISEKKKSDEEIWRRANFDVLTGLPNRSMFRDRLEHEVIASQRSNRALALLFIDLDRFKEVNDLLGHDAGDMLLRQAADRISSCVRGSDTVARLGGDEFTVILTALDNIAHVNSIAQKILYALARPFRFNQEVIRVSGSIGITIYPEDAGEPEHLVRNADQAMYVAKNAGRNQFSYFTRSMQDEAQRRLRLIEDLRHAVPERQLKAYFQPIVDLSSGQIVKAEALVRWLHPEKGLMSPTEFIELAEETGVINEIGNWVFIQAVAWSKRWSDEIGQKFQISINKSPAEFMSQSTEINWATHLRDLGLAWNSISVEITEGLLLNTSPEVEDKLLALRGAGIQVAIDDFGTGYSSMAYLKKFDVDYLKIDQSFVRDTANIVSSRTIAETIIVMAHKLGLKVIAEGIETAEQRDWLKSAGCDFAQGFLFSEPIPPERFEKLLKTSFGLPL